MDYEAQQRVQSDLDSSERMLWAGRPKQGVIFRKSDVFMIPFSLVWCAGAVFITVAAARTGVPVYLLAVNGLFVLIGLHLLIGRFFVDAHHRKNTYYAITDERVVIRSGRQLKSLSLRTLSDISLVKEKGRYGTILLGSASTSRSEPRGFSRAGGPGWPPRLEGIENAEDVFDLLRRAQRES